MAIRFKAATTLSIILFIAFALELIAVLSVPVTSKISLSTFEDYRFGVFGYCNTKTNTCTKVGIGYNIPENDNKFRLPSSARRSLSNLLIVHVVAAGLSFILFVCAVLAHVHGPGSSQKYLLCLLLLALPSFLISLLAFLVDILLFVSHLDWGGWIMLAATVLTAFSGIILCLMRRTLSSQKAMKRRANASNANSELQDFSFSPTKFQNDLPPTMSRGYSEIKFQPTNVSGEDSLPLNGSRDGHGTGNVGDYSFNSAVTDSSSYIHHERTPSPSREFRHGNGFSYRGGYTRTGDGGPNQLEFNNSRTETGSFTSTVSSHRGAAAVPGQPQQVIPAGTYITGVEDNNNFGPNVIPLPRIRQVQHQQPQVQHQQPVHENEYSNSNAVAYGEYPAKSVGTGQEDLPVMNRRPSGPRMLPVESSAVIEDSNAQGYVPPRQLWQQQQPQNNQAPPNSQPPPPLPPLQPQQQPLPQENNQQPHARRRSSAGQTYRQFFVEDEAQELPIDNEPLQLPGTNEAIYAGPASPATSDTSSNYTSISQRPVNPRYYQPQRGPDRSEFVLQNNPDFNLGLPVSSRKKNVGGPRGPRGPPGRTSRPPAASQTSDGPYGFTR